MVVLDIDFITVFKRFKFLKLGDLFTIYNASSLRQYKKGELIAQQNHTFPYLLGVRKGLIRT
jgi:signal-transduction protein with cAMP-binding, CBS, and nucleotidyltransferase domain